MANNPFGLRPLKPFLPPYSSPPRVPQPPQPELLASPDFSPARVIPDALLRPSPKKNGLNMRGKGGTYKYQAPEEIARSRIRNTLDEENRERAQKARARLIFDPAFVNRWERGDPIAHQRLANLGRAAAGEKPLPALPIPPPPPFKAPRERGLYNSPQRKSLKRPRNNNQNMNTNTRRINRLKNRRNK